MGVLLEVSAVVFNERWKSWNRDRRKLGLSVESDYKLFRDSVQGRAIMDDINEIINGEILKQLEVVGEKCFSNIEALTFFVAERIDLPDKLIAAVAVDCGYIVFTHDSDFLHTAVDILTANGKILRVIR
jgi:predicted nucleic acid-binding protein